VNKEVETAWVQYSTDAVSGKVAATPSANIFFV